MMKRSELVVGGEYYYSTDQKWREHLYRSSRAVAIDTGFWKQNHDPWARDNKPYRAPDGTPGCGVLVDLYWANSQGEVKEPSREAVSLTSLRGPWAELSAWADATKREREIERVQARERQDQLRARKEELRYRAG